MDSTGFGKRLKQMFRGARNIDIAEKLGVSPAAVGNYMSGRVPDAEKLQKIAELTKCNLHWLLTGNGHPFFHDIVESKPQSESQSNEAVNESENFDAKREIPWDEIYVLFSGLERFPDDPEDLDELKMELEVVYHEIQKRLKQAEILKRRNESNPQKSTDRN